MSMMLVDEQPLQHASFRNKHKKMFRVPTILGGDFFRLGWGRMIWEEHFKLFNL